MKRKQGISLIVLVITIIVMVILAAAVIISLTSSGIIDRANQAVQVTNVKQVENIVALAWADAYSSGERSVEKLQESVDNAMRECKIDTNRFKATATATGVSVVEINLDEDDDEEELPDEPVGPTLITFIISDTSYQAEEGMTWSAWLASSYNTANYTTPVINKGSTVGLSYDTAIDANETYEFITANCWTSPSNMHYHNGQKYTGTCGSDTWQNGEWVSSCFVAGTKVLMADKTTKNIEEMEVGDKVLSYNRLTGEFYITTVTQTMKHEVAVTYYDIKLEDGTVIGATGNHPMLTEEGFKCVLGNSKDVKDCGELVEGDSILTVDGYKKVVAIIKKNEKVKVYNINVADDDEVLSGEDNDEEDTYVVEGAVCHNKTHSGGSN